MSDTRTHGRISLVENEEFLAPFVAAHRDEITLATKFALAYRADDPGHRAIRNDRPYIRQAVEASLRRLGVDVIDLYYMHRRDPAAPLADSVGAMAELVREGKVGHLGLSEVTGAELREAHAVHPIATLRSTEDDYRRTMPRYSGANAKANAALLAPLRAIAAEHGASIARIALAWVQQRSQAHGLTVVPIPGTRKRARLLENTAATRITLGDADLALLEPPASQVAGRRAGDMSLTSTARE